MHARHPRQHPRLLFVCAVHPFLSCVFGDQVYLHFIITTLHLVPLHLVLLWPCCTKVIEMSVVCEQRPRLPTDHQVNGKACTHSRDATFSPLEPFLFFNPISCFYDFLWSLLFCVFFLFCFISFFYVMFSNDWTVLEMQWLLNYPYPQLHSGGEASEILPKISCAAHPLIRMKSNWQFWWLTSLTLILSPQL